MSGPKRFPIVQCIPSCQSCTRKCCCFSIRQVDGNLNQAILVENAIFTHSTIDVTTKISPSLFQSESTGIEILKISWRCTLAFLEECNFPAHSYNFASAIRTTLMKSIPIFCGRETLLLTME